MEMWTEREEEWAKNSLSSRSYALANPSNNQGQQQRRQQLNVDVAVNANEWNALCKVSAKRMNK